MTNAHIPSDDIKDIINEFFFAPTTPKSPPGLFSSLYLLRRDAAQCMGINPNTFQPFPPGTAQALWPGLMGVFAGIDLLAKFYKGDGGPIKNRFEDYCKDYVVPEHRDWKESLWKLRNSVMHSFGLYGGMVNGKKERYLLTAGLGTLLSSVETDSERHVQFDVKEIRSWFEEYIPQFRGWLETSPDVPTDLKELFIKYGFTRIGNITVPVTSGTNVFVGSGPSR